jgi:hypothetical protein
MKINLQLTFNDGKSKDIVANAADMVAFEEKYEKSVQSLASDPRMSYLFWLAWHSEKRRGETTLEFDKWLETIEMVGAGEDPK